MACPNLAKQCGAKGRHFLDNEKLVHFRVAGEKRLTVGELAHDAPDLPCQTPRCLGGGGTMAQAHNGETLESRQGEAMAQQMKVGRTKRDVLRKGWPSGPEPVRGRDAGPHKSQPP